MALPQQVALLSGFVASVWLRDQWLGRAKRVMTPWGPRWLAIAMAEFLGKVAGAAGVQFETDTEEKWHKDPQKRLDPQKQYMVAWHPHGAITFGAAFFTSKMAAQSTTSSAPGPQSWFVGIADLLFRFPLLGEFLMLVNCRPVSEATAKAVLKQGHSYGLQPGGIPEQVLTDHRRELIAFPPSLGFCRLAIQHGIPVVPIYVFGENQVFTTYDWSRNAVTQIHGKLGMAVPLVNPLPNKLTLHMKWGRPVDVGERDQNPSEDRVQCLFAHYLVEVARLFEEHRDQCLPEAVAAKGLTVFWRGHSKEQLDGLLAKVDFRSDKCPCLVTATGVSNPIKTHSRL